MRSPAVWSWVTLVLVSCSSGAGEEANPPGGSGGAGGSGGVSGSSASGGSGGAPSGGRGGSGAGAGASGSSSAGSGGMGGDGGGAGGSSGAGGSGGQSGAGGASCGPPCGEPSGYEVGCCGDRCTGLYNDPMHCGDCDVVCPESAPFCDNGSCEPLPACNGTSCDGAQTCCGGACCEAGQICCGVNVGPFIYQCHTPTEEMPSCPIGCPSCLCASPDTPIATPDGERPIASIAVGDLVYSVDHGMLTPVPVASVRRSPAIGHHVVHVTLATGVVLDISAPHPTADGRTFGELSLGSKLGEVEIVGLEVKPYLHAFTHDILPASDTGSYVAGGVLIGSTLAEQPRACVP